MRKLGKQRRWRDEVALLTASPSRQVLRLLVNGRIMMLFWGEGRVFGLALPAGLRKRVGTAPARFLTALLPSASHRVEALLPCSVLWGSEIIAGLE